jgi:hypothetical protein
MKRKKPDALETLKAARDQLAAAIEAGETSEARLNALRIKATALEAETQEAIDPLDRQSVTKRAECLAQKAAIETELLSAETVRAENGEAVHAALQACAIPVKEIANEQAGTMETRLVEFLESFCKDKTKARHIAEQCDALQYVRAASTTMWANASDAATARWVKDVLIGRLVSDRPCLWPQPQKLVLDSASMA